MKTWLPRLQVRLLSGLHYGKKDIKPNTFGSRPLRNTEKNYSIGELELLAVL